MPNPVGIVDVDLTALAATVTRLEARVAALEETVAALTEARTPPDRAESRPVLEPDVTVPSVAAWTTAAVVALSGRTLVALGGGYLLRALTDGGALPPAAGVLAGFAYSVVWALLSIRAGGAGARPNATFHGLTSALIAFPLVWEASTRFHLLGAGSGAVVLVLCCSVLFVAARRTGAEAVAWFGGLGAVVTGVGLAVSTAAFVPFTVALAVIGVTAVWLGYLEEWVLLRWPIAAAVDLMVLLVTIRVIDRDVGAPWTPALAVQLLILALYLCTFVGRSLLLGREVIVFEVAQTAAAMAVCFGGALWILTTKGLTALPLGLAALMLGPAAYAFAFTFADRRRQPRNVAFFSSLALALTLAGFAIVLPLPLAGAATAILAVAAAAWARSSDRATLSLHALVAATLAAGITGLARVAFSGLTASTDDVWPQFTAAHLATSAVVVAVCLWPSPASASERVRAALRVATATLLTWIVTGAAIAIVIPLLMDPARRDAGAVATIRTVSLVAAALVLVTRARREAVWVSYGVLGLIGLKLVAEDLLRGRPATLFVALAVYGAALILIPRLARRSEQPASGAA